MVYDGLVEDNRVVVIGSGPPGAAAAVFLRRAGAEVLMLEAGSEHSARGLTFRVHGMTVAKRRGPLTQRAGVNRTAGAGRPGGPAARSSTRTRCSSNSFRREA